MLIDIVFDAGNNTFNVMDGLDCLYYTQCPDALLEWLDSQGYEQVGSDSLVYIRSAD